MSPSTVSPTTVSPTAPSEVLTATPRRMLRRRAGLIGLIAFVLLAVIALIVVRSSASASTDPLDISNPAPNGARALAQVLGQQGVTVVAADSVRSVRSHLADAQQTTVLVYDPQGYLTGGQRRELMGLGTDLVVIEPGLLALDDYAPQLGLAGERSGKYSADCSVDAVQKAAQVVGSGLGYRVLDEAAADGAVVPCLRSKGVAGMVQLTEGSRTITILGLGSVLQNDTIGRQGDAALALNLLGAHPTLIWDISTYADLQVGSQPSLPELIPGWVTPLMGLLGLVGIAAMVWRGRRFGPIVVENLPVVVRASETMEGRARLYSRANARVRALDALRIGTISRLARLMGLPRAASVDQVIDAIASLLGRDRGEIAALLLDNVPSNDAALVRLSDLLLALEADVTTAVAP